MTTLPASSETRAARAGPDDEAADMPDHCALSVVVITYNSARFVRETLESIRQQTYPGIELIVSDDRSTDATVQVCEDWLSRHRDRFVATQIVTSEENTGIAPNCNRGLRAARGRWVKLLAGDDLLAPTFAAEVIACAERIPDARVLVCDVESFLDGSDTTLSRWPGSKFRADPRSHLKRQLLGGHINAAGIILRRALLLEAGGFDERFPFLEDDPMWIRLLVAGEHFHRCPAALVRKRDHPESVSISSGERFVNPVFFDSSRRFKEAIALPLMRKRGMSLGRALTLWDLQISQRILADGNNAHGANNRRRLRLLGLVRIGRRWLGRYYRIEHVLATRLRPATAMSGPDRNASGGSDA